MSLDFLLPIAHVFVYVALLAWVATFFGLVHSLVSALIPALHSAKGPPRFSVRSDFAARPGFSVRTESALDPDEFRLIDASQFSGCATFRHETAALDIFCIYLQLVQSA